MMLNLGGLPALVHVIRRVKRAKQVSEVVVATSRESGDDEIVELSARENVGIYRGSLDNVLQRYVEAASQFSGDVIVRITGDSPVLESQWIDDAILKLKSNQLDYVGAKSPEEFPVGMGNEVMTFELLQKSLKLSKTQEDFEHVTWYCLSHQNEFKIAFLSNPDKISGVDFRVTLDEESDLKLLREVFARLGSTCSYQNLADLYKKEPSLFDINRNVKEKPNLYARNDTS